ncbi:hypothetical protein [Streptomyces sp. VMFN-G11Ma]|uniref:hypothetical protein n=1 Tax=Streptomyces sp. VMFN-G11Ma TaxID=2135609 RepID=UPI000D3AD39D|nr:hypothetical protein [Streptomyces sp. VMFN-G11Ma]
MTPESSGHEHLPVYESLLRERGDVVAEARVAAEHLQHQAPQPPGGHAQVPAPHHHPVHRQGPQHPQHPHHPQHQ